MSERDTFFSSAASLLGGIPPELVTVDDVLPECFKRSGGPMRRAREAYLREKTTGERTTPGLIESETVLNRVIAKVEPG